MRRLWAPVTALLATAAVTAPLPGPTPPAHASATATVWPTPQQISDRSDGFRLPRTVGLVATADADAPALRTVRAVLKKAGATDIRQSAADPKTEVTVWLSGGAPVLKGLGVADHTGLGPEGYVLAAGRYRGRDHIVL